RVRVGRIEIDGAAEGAICLLAVALRRVGVAELPVGLARVGLLLQGVAVFDDRRRRAARPQVVVAASERGPCGLLAAGAAGCRDGDGEEQNSSPHDQLHRWERNGSRSRTNARPCWSATGRDQASRPAGTTMRTSAASLRWRRRLSCSSQSLLVSSPASIRPCTAYQ